VNVRPFCLLRALQNVFELARPPSVQVRVVHGARAFAGQSRRRLNRHWSSGFALVSGNHNTDTLQDPATWLRQLMGAESQTGDKVWGRVFTVMLAQEGGGVGTDISGTEGARRSTEHSSHSYLKELVIPDHFSVCSRGRLSRGVNLSPKLERHPSSNK
jgi:hypothetical protein